MGIESLLQLHAEQFVHGEALGPWRRSQPRAAEKSVEKCAGGPASDPVVAELVAAVVTQLLLRGAGATLSPRLPRFLTNQPRPTPVPHEPPRPTRRPTHDAGAQPQAPPRTPTSAPGPATRGRHANVARAVKARATRSRARARRG